jgi:hypothetical protein
MPSSWICLRVKTALLLVESDSDTMFWAARLAALCSLVAALFPRPIRTAPGLVSPLLLGDPK